MSNLLSSLTLAAQSLDAQRYGLDVAGHNIANVMTPSYARRLVDFASVTSSDSYGGGVRAVGVRAMRDTSLDRLVRQALSAERREEAIVGTLSIIEASIGRPGESIDGRLTAFFNAFASLADDTQSTVARSEVQSQGKALANAFRSMSDQLTASGRDTDVKIRSVVDQINLLSQQIASVNGALSAGSASEPNLDLQDRQSHLVRQLSELVDVGVTPRPGGGVDVTFGSGRPLVIGNTPCAVTATLTPPSGFVTLSSGGSAVRSEIRGGTLGGLLHVRDVLLPSYQEGLDALAAETIAQVNALHTAGSTQTGSTAGNFFSVSTASAGIAGSAATMTLDARVATDAREIAAGATTEGGDNAVAKAIAALRRPELSAGTQSTLVERWSQLVYRVGRDTQQATQEQRSQSMMLLQSEKLRDQLSGVSLDEEAMLMLKYQRAYEASARFFVTINQTLDVLLNLVSR